MPAPSAVVMVRPRRFFPNPATEVDNAFQTRASEPPSEVAAAAFDEVTVAAERLRVAGVTVHCVDDDHAGRPDAVFPNNWLSTHADGIVVLYPMRAPNRRLERRADVVDMLRERYLVDRVIDLSAAEQGGRFLEGTGAMVIDHAERVAYVARSLRTDAGLVDEVCAALGLTPVVFDTADAAGVPIYHTNVMLCVGDAFAAVGTGLITERSARRAVADRLAADGRRDLIELSAAQIGEFAGNMLELEGSTGRILALSSRAERSLTPAQRRIIERSCTLLPLDVPTIELAGGSVRCMLADVHLTPIAVAVDPRVQRAEPVAA